MSLGSLSPTSRYHARIAITKALKGYLLLLSEDGALSHLASARSPRLRAEYARDCAEILHDLGGLAAAW